jgi:iron-sulfur cluster assembly accessory protein
MRTFSYPSCVAFLLGTTLFVSTTTRECQAWVVASPQSLLASRAAARARPTPFFLSAEAQESESEPTTATATATATTSTTTDDNYEIPEDAVVTIKPAAMDRLRELRVQQKLPADEPLRLRMGVRSGGCSGMSYVMDIAKEGDRIAEDDAVDNYGNGQVECVVDAKSMLYLYGLELDYSTELVGGGFKFTNPNAEESCGCGSSFGV